MIPNEAINITNGIPPEIYVGIGRGHYDGKQGDYELAQDVAASVRAECKAEIERLEAESKDDQDTIDILMDSEKRAVGILAPLLGDGHTKDTLLLLANKIKAKIERLRAVMDAADAFLTQPPDDMPDARPYNQYTTAGDCRALNEAYHKAAEAGGGKR